LTDKDQEQASKYTGGGTERRQLTGHFVLDLPQPECNKTQGQKAAKSFLDRLKADFQKPRFYLELGALIGLFCYAHSASIQAVANKRSADAGLISAQTAQAQLELSERPWVSVDFEILQPLSFDDKGASLGVRWHLKNIGHSIASKVTVRDTLFAVNLTGKFVDIYSSPVAEESRMCEPTPWLTEMSSIITGFRLFPDEDVSRLDTARVSQADIAKANTWLNTPKPTGPLDSVGIMLVGCVTYQSIFGHHHTGFLRVLGAAQPDGSTTIRITPSGTHPDLTLEQFSIGNSAD
jgi:hypothetical protein